MANISIIKSIDKLIGNALCLILFSRKKEIELKKSKKILFIQLWGIGETILTLPAILAVKKRFKDSSIYVLATDRNKEVYLHSIDVNLLTTKLSVFSLLRLIFYGFRKYDIVIDMEEYLNISSLIAYFLGRQRIGFSHGLRSRAYNSAVKYNDKQHVLETFNDLVKCMDVKKEGIVKLNYSEDDKKKISKILAGNNEKLIGIVAGAAESGKSRMWPYFKELCKELNKSNTLVFIGSELEKEVNSDIIKELNKNVIDTTGKISLSELFCLVEKLDLIITNDTGPLHIASAQGTKTIGLFGPNTPVRFGPLAKDSIAVYHPENCEFSPCINVHKGKVPDCLYPKKSIDYQKCMKAIGVEEVVEEAEKSL